MMFVYVGIQILSSVNVILWMVEAAVASFIFNHVFLSFQWRILDPCLRNGTLKTDNGRQVPNPRCHCAWSSVLSSSTTPSTSTQSSMGR